MINESFVYFPVNVSVLSRFLSQQRRNRKWNSAITERSHSRNLSNWPLCINVVRHLVTVKIRACARVVPFGSPKKGDRRKDTKGSRENRYKIKRPGSAPSAPSHTRNRRRCTPVFPQVSTPLLPPLPLTMHRSNYPVNCNGVPGHITVHFRDTRPYRPPK